MILKLGSTGSSVATLQQKLGIDDDGIFGPQTMAAVLAFQSAHGLVKDGIVGPVTLTVLGAVRVIDIPPSRIHGADMYDLDVINDWSLMKASGIEFMSIKATQGTYNRQKNYATSKTKAKAVGMIAGPYHFIDFENDPKLQGEFFSEYILEHGGLDDEDLPPMHDWEYWKDSRQVRPGDGEASRIFLQEVETRLKRIPFIYSGYFTIMEILDNEPECAKWMSRYPFWLAWYSSETNIKTPTPWQHWTIWQSTGEAHIPGAGNPFDFDTFNGTLDDLKALIKASKV